MPSRNVPTDLRPAGRLAAAACAAVLALALSALGQGVDPATPPLTPPSSPQPSPAPVDPEAATFDEPAEELDSFSGPAEVTVHLKDGQRFTGLLIDQTPDHLILRIEGIQTRFSAAAVDRIRAMRPVLERYEEMRAAMGDDPSQITKLADWLRARERYELALEEVERALRLAPDNVEARQLRLLIAKQIELRERAKPGESRRPILSEESLAGHPVNEVQLNFPLLSPDQIALMKVYEVDLSKSPRIVIRRETISKLLERYRAHHLIPVTQEARDAIYRWSPRQVLDLMFRVQARDLYSEVQIVDHPESIRLFRDTVHRTWLINSCATNACHGGAEAGRLILSNRRPNAEASVYTNLLIMERYRLNDGTPLLNYENPERSPLLQMAMPRQDAVFRHPQVPMGASGADGWKPVFRSTDDRRFQQAVEWMKAMYRPRPEYSIDYTPPGASVSDGAVPEPTIR